MTKNEITREIEICDLVTEELKKLSRSSRDHLFICKIGMFSDFQNKVPFGKLSPLVERLYQFGIDKDILVQNHYRKHGFQFYLQKQDPYSYNKRKIALLESYKKHLKSQL